MLRRIMTVAAAAALVALALTSAAALVALDSCTSFIPAGHILSLGQRPRTVGRLNKNKGRASCPALSSRHGLMTRRKEPWLCKPGMAQAGVAGRHRYSWSYDSS
jgi:hypothetical protein